MTTTQSLQIFLRALQGQNFSPKTLRAYGDDLGQFLRFVEKNRVDWDSPTRFDRADIEGFMQYLAAQRMTGVTRVRKLAAIRKFFTFLEENRILAANPGNAVKGARREEKEPNIWDCLKTGPEACWQVDTFSGQLTGAQSPQNNMITSV